MCSEEMEEYYAQISQGMDGRKIDDGTPLMAAIMEEIVKALPGNDAPFAVMLRQFWLVVNLCDARYALRGELELPEKGKWDATTMLYMDLDDIEGLPDLLHPSTPAGFRKYFDIVRKRCENRNVVRDRIASFGVDADPKVVEDLAARFRAAVKKADTMMIEKVSRIHVSYDTEATPYVRKVIRRIHALTGPIRNVTDGRSRFVAIRRALKSIRRKLIAANGFEYPLWLLKDIRVPRNASIDQCRTVLADMRAIMEWGFDFLA